MKHTFQYRSNLVSGVRYLILIIVAIMEKAIRY